MQNTLSGVQKYVVCIPQQGDSNGYVILMDTKYDFMERQLLFINLLPNQGFPLSYNILGENGVTFIQRGFHDGRETFKNVLFNLFISTSFIASYFFPT